MFVFHAKSAQNTVRPYILRVDVELNSLSKTEIVYIIWVFHPKSARNIYGRTVFRADLARNT